VFQLPWTEKTVPNFTLEVNNTCNVACKTCYKRFDGTTKPLSQIEEELDFISSRRHLQTVSIAGGEPTLHPELPAIVKLIRSRGFKATLITNGVAVDRPLLQRLQQAGLNMVMFHIDSRQQRPDLPREATPAQVQALRDEKVELAGALGVDAGLSVVVSRENFDELLPLVTYVLARKEISYLLVTHALALDWFVETAGTYRRDREQGEAELASNQGFQRRTTNEEVRELLRERFGIEPLSYLPSATVNGLRRQLQWFNYSVPVVYRADGSYRLFPVRAGLADLWVLKAYAKLAGRYAYYTRQDGALMAAQFLINGLLSRRPKETAQFLAELAHQGASLRGKRFAFDNGHFLTEAGQVACMDHCPNPTVKNGRIVPVCLADHQEA
jgi:MoaA/NifB/PqqE/SkfB family radical SAM enzyme